MYTNFEIDIHSAIRGVFNGRFIIKGCRFHLGQSWWRKIQELGLSTCRAGGALTRFILFEVGAVDREKRIRTQ